MKQIKLIISSILLSILVLTGCNDSKETVAAANGKTATTVITTTVATTAAIPQIDCFEGVEITLSGISPDGKLTINKENASQEIRKFVNFKSDLSSDIHDGDTIVVTAYYDDATVRYEQTKEFFANLPRYATMEDIESGTQLNLTVSDNEFLVNAITKKQEEFTVEMNSHTKESDSEYMSDYLVLDLANVNKVELDNTFYLMNSSKFFVNNPPFEIIFVYSIDNSYTVNQEGTDYVRVRLNKLTGYIGEMEVAKSNFAFITFDNPLIKNGEIQYEIEDAHISIINPDSMVFDMWNPDDESFVDYMKKCDPEYIVL